MGRFSDYFRSRGGNNDENNENNNANNGANYEYYEDTHDLDGNYTGRLRQSQMQAQRGYDQTEPRLDRLGDRNDRLERREMPPVISTRNFSNFMVYEPRTADDVQTIIDFLKTKESAIINLNNADPDTSQRVLDFVSGAIYALSGSVHRIEGNIFLLSPEGVGITNNHYVAENNED